MADVKERISIEGNFKEQVQAFVDGLIKSRMELKKLVMNTVSGTKNINSSVSLSVKAINKFASEFIKQGDTVEQAIKKATDKVERYQEGAINRLAKKYIALGKTITEAYSQAQKDIDIKWNGSQPKPSSIDNFVTSFFGSKFGKGLTVMTVMSMTVKTIEGMFKVANGISDQTLSVMDKLTGGMISEKGLEYSLKNAIDFESVKTNIDLLSKNVKGADSKKIYSDATKLAVQTRFTEKEMASNAEWMLKGGINPTEQTLRSLANLASLKPELGGEHSGFAVFDAMMGRVTSLKTNYGIDNEKLMKFQKTLSGKDKTATDQALEKKGQGYVIKDKQEWMNLFNAYMEKNYGNLAKSQSETLGGLVSTLQGQLEQISSTLMGLDTKNGEIVEGSLVYELKKAIGSSTDKTGLLGWLQELDKSTEFKELQQSLGEFVRSISDLGKELVDSGTIEELMSIGSDFIGDITDFIKELKDTGELKYILEKSPELLKASLDYELQKMKTLEKMSALYDPAIKFMEFMTRILEDMANLADTVTGKDKLNEDNINAGKFIGKTLIPGGNLVVSTIDGFNLAKNWFGNEDNIKDTGKFIGKTLIPGGNIVASVMDGFKLAKNWFSGNKDNDESQVVKKYNDYSAEHLINGANNISLKEKETVKEIIEKDGINNYTITVNGNTSDSELVRKLIDEIERIQKNR